MGLWPEETIADFWNTLYLCLPVRPAKAVPELGPMSSAIDFATKPTINFLGVMARWPASAQTWTQTWILQPDQRAVKVLSRNISKCTEWFRRQLRVRRVVPTQPQATGKARPIWQLLFVFWKLQRAAGPSLGQEKLWDNNGIDSDSDQKISH